MTTNIYCIVTLWDCEYLPRVSYTYFI